MFMPAEDLAKAKGADLLRELRYALVHEDADIRFRQRLLVRTGDRTCPDPDQVAKADAFHAVGRMLEEAIHAGPTTTVQDLTKTARKALSDAVIAREANEASGSAESAGDNSADQAAGV